MKPLLFFQVAIVAFGLFSGGAAGRSSTNSELSQADMTGGMCFLLYTGGDEEKLSCIARCVNHFLFQVIKKVTN